MEHEIIERLAIDNALGELNDDVAALLETYLTEHAEARVWATSITQTCRQTREAIGLQTQSIARNDPPARAHLRWPIHIDGWALGRWAAVIVLSLGIGGALGRRSTPKTPAAGPTIVRAEQQASPKNWGQVLSESGEGFWQTKALAMLQSKSHEVPRPRHDRAGLWDRYRQSRKERSYE